VWCDIRWLRRIFKFDRSWNIGFEIHVLYVRHALLSLSFRLTTTGLMTLLLFSGFRLFKGNFIKKLRLKDKITSDQQQQQQQQQQKTMATCFRSRRGRRPASGVSRTTACVILHQLRKAFTAFSSPVGSTWHFGPTEATCWIDTAFGGASFVGSNTTSINWDLCVMLWPAKITHI
jgi:hypothetical protein